MTSTGGGSAMSFGAPGISDPLVETPANQSAAEVGPIYEPTLDTLGGGRHSPEAFLAAMGGAVVLSNADKIINVAGKLGSGVISTIGAGGSAAAATAEVGVGAATTAATVAPNLITSIVESTLSANGIGLGLEMGGKALEAGASAVLSTLATAGKFAVESAISIATNPMVLTTLAIYGAYVYRDKLAVLAKKVVKFPKTMWAKMIKSEVGDRDKTPIGKITTNAALAAAAG